MERNIEKPSAGSRHDGARDETRGDPPSTAFTPQGEPINREAELRKRAILAMAAAKAIYAGIAAELEPAFQAVRQEYASMLKAWGRQTPHIQKYGRMIGLDRRKFHGAVENFHRRRTELLMKFKSLEASYDAAEKAIGIDLQRYREQPTRPQPIMLIEILKNLADLLVVATKPPLMICETSVMKQDIQERLKVLGQTPKPEV